MRVIFAGGKNVGYACLESLIQLKYDIVAVIINRKGEFDENRWFKSTAELALKNGLKLLMPDDINAPACASMLRSLKPDLLAVAYYDQILKEEVISIPKLGCINLHFALAEQYRGCYPTTWAIINGETHTGVTIHYIDEGVDSGDILAEEEIIINRSDTGRTLYDKCSEVGARLFAMVLPRFESGKVPARKQKSERVKYYERVFPSHQVDFTRSGEEIRNFLRAVSFDPFPPPYFYLGDTKMVIVPESRTK